MKEKLSQTDELGLRAMIATVNYLGRKNDFVSRKEIDNYLRRTLSLTEWDKSRLYGTLGWFAAYKPRLIDTIRGKGWILTEYGKELYAKGTEDITKAVLQNRQIAEEENNNAMRKRISDVINDRPFIVIDLYSGSYTKSYTGHEKYNLDPNPIDGKYYGYCPPYDDIDIKKLGAKKGETFVEGITVVYVQKTANSNDREIIAFCDEATVFAPCVTDSSLNRSGVDKTGKTIDISYSIMSDNIIDLTKVRNKFIIAIKKYNNQMFRHQRFYKGTYPALDVEILEYLKQQRQNQDFLDDEIYQTDIQESFGKSGSDEDVKIGNGSASEMVKRNSALAKIAISKAEFKCEFDDVHYTFKTSKGLPYMEGHHLIPCTPLNARKFLETYGTNIDCVENVISLCPTCHRRIHFGSQEERRAIIKKLYELRKSDLERIGISITLQELYNLYE